MKHPFSSFTLGVLFIVAVGCTLEAAAEQQSPNILLILADDLSPFSLHAYGNTVCETPNIDRLAAEGLTFDAAYHMGAWTGAVCTASRTMIMTGRTVWHIPGARGTPLDRNKQYRQTAAEQSLPAIFNRAGYSTFRTCKEGNSYDEANRLFQVSKIAGTKMRIDPRNSNWHGDRIVEYLEERAKSDDRGPMLLYFGMTHPHDPRYGLPELLDKYGAVNDGDLATPNPNAPALPKNYLPAHPFPHGHPGLRDEEKVQGVMTRRDEATVRNEIGREYACIENIDREIGRVLEQLDAMGELDNTYIFFTSDHGIAVGRHGLMGKQNLYEHTWRVPMIVRGPGIKAGARTDAMVYLLDLLPTFCQLTGTPIPDTVEGESFDKVLHGKTTAARDVVYGVYCGGTKPGIRSVRKGNWKLVTHDLLQGKVQQTQLFDLTSNPQELLAEHHTPALQAKLNLNSTPDQVNLADDPQFVQKRTELEQLLREQQQRWDDPYLEPTGASAAEN